MKTNRDKTVGDFYGTTLRRDENRNVEYKESWHDTIEAIVHDAQRFIALRREYGTFAK